MESYCRIKEDIIETPEKVKNFYKELFELYEKYNISISHEDQHGGFILVNNESLYRDWIQEAALCSKEPDDLLF
jgi:GTP cyclohydrolase I